MYRTNNHFKKVLVNFFGYDANISIKRLSSGAVSFTAGTENGLSDGIIYQNTIVAMGIDNRIILNSGGRKTVTTKKWMNHYLQDTQYGVYQKDFIRYIRQPESAENIDIDFVDNIILKR